MLSRTYAEEKLGVERVAAQAVNGPVVTTQRVLDTIHRVLGLAVTREDGALGVRGRKGARHVG